MRKLYQATLFAFTVILLAACSAMPDTKEAYTQYAKRFNDNLNPIVHKLQRDDGRTLHVREFGAIHRDKTPSFVLMHGFPDNQHLYDLLITELAQTHHVVSFDFLGWGYSDKPTNHNYEVQSQRVDLETVIKGLNLNTVSLVVHDLSGQPGIDWALDNEAKISELVLLNTYYHPMANLVAPDAIDFYATPGVLRDLARWGANKSESRFKSGLSDQIGKFFSNPDSKAIFVPVFADFAPSIRPAFFSATAALWSELANREKMIPRLKSFQKPVRVIFGENDPFLNPEIARQFSETFLNSCTSLIKNAGHYVQLDNASAVRKAMLSVPKTGGSCLP